MKLIELDRDILFKICEAIRKIEFSLLVGCHFKTTRDRCEFARDLMHQAVTAMEQNGDAEEHEWAYTQLFDALSYTTSALIAKPFSFTLVREALQKLRNVRDSAVRS